MESSSNRFVTAAEKVDVQSPWTLEEWFCRSDIVPNRELLMVRANMEPGRSHPFHTHPNREEIIYVLSGRAEQRINRDRKSTRLNSSHQIISYAVFCLKKKKKKKKQYTSDKTSTRI